MGKEIKTEELNAALKKADDTLHSINDQMSVINEIRVRIEDGSPIEEIEDYIKQFLAMAVKTKANALKEIERLHLALAERHMKLTNKWAFVERKDIS